MNKKAILVALLFVMALGLWSLFSQDRNAEPASSLLAPTNDVIHVPEELGSLPDQHVEPSTARQVAEPEEATKALVTAREVSTSVTPPVKKENSIVVTVLDPQGRPISIAKVIAEDPSSDFRAKSLAQGTTDKDGRARLNGIPPGHVRVIAEALQFAPGASEMLRFKGEGETQTIQLILTKGGSLKGRLFDRNGLGAQEVSLSIHLQVWPGSTEKTHPKGILQQCKTSADGSFLFEQLTAGAHRLHLRPTDAQKEFVSTQSIDVNVIEGQTTEVIIANDGSSSVRLTGVILRNEQPLPGARLAFNWTDRGRSRINRKCKTDEDGRFEVVLDEGGDYTIGIYPGDDGGTVYLRQSIPQEQDHETVIPFQTEHIRGRVLDPDGTPMEGIEVIATGRVDGPGSDSSVSILRTDAQGAFVFSDVICAAYTLTASRGASDPRPQPSSSRPYIGRAQIKGLELRQGSSISDLELRLSRAAAIEGKVTDLEGEPIPRAYIEMRRLRSTDHRDTSRWLSDSSGNFLGGGLVPGEYLVRAKHQDQATAWMQVSAQLGTNGVATLILAPGTTLNVAAYFSGHLLASGTAFVKDAKGLIPAYERLRLGRAQLGPLPPGTYTLTVTTRDETPQRKHVEEIVVSGEDTISVDVNVK